MASDPNTPLPLAGRDIEPDQHPRSLRLIYAAGPGDVIGTFRHWQQQVEDPNEIVPTYSGQFFQICQRDGHRAWVIAWHPRAEHVRHENFHIEHRPKNLLVPGWKYHLTQMLWAARLTGNALWFRADAIILNSGACHWFGLALLPLLRVRVVSCLHNVLWTEETRRSKIQRLELSFSGRMMQWGVAAFLSCSRAISRQIGELTGERHGPIFEFLPVYRREYFASTPPPPESRQPFRVLYVGRIEPEKGVFEVLAIARTLQTSRPGEFVFDFCGEGSARAELDERVRAFELGEVVRCHGHCGRERLREMYGSAHAVVVPTQSRIGEGLNQVVIEAVLAGRPVVASDVCPANAYLAGAVIPVPADEPGAYQAALERLRDEPAYYARVRAECAAVSEPFYNCANGWGAAVTRLLAALFGTQSSSTPSPR